MSDLINELCQLWLDETDLRPPYTATLQTWVESTGRISDVFTAIRVTGRKVRLVKGTQTEFNLPAAAAFCRNAIRRIQSERIAAEYKKVAR